ncbi:DUF3108 domain-containing protein [Desulfococcus sp.]|uniref:DUF3108 domain-containing protein n=1 Tax=Desulfococcus sp. TaxID=2025834 RepID=UPI0035939A36
MGLRLRASAGALLALGCMMGRVAAAEAPPEGLAAFQPGERLVYALKWEFITAGEATLEVLPDASLEGRSVRRFVLTAGTNSFLDKIYKVRNRIESFTDLSMDHSILYRKKQREGRHEGDIIVRFDWHRKTAVYTNFGSPRNPVALMSGAFDPLGAFYFVRTVGLATGKVVDRPVSDGKKCVLGRVRVLGRETIRVNGRDYDTYRLDPDLKHVGGVFSKSRNAKIELWVSADHRHIPVRIKSRVAVGSFVGELISDSGAAAPGPGITFGGMK